MIQPTPTQVSPFVKKWKNDGTLCLPLNEDRTAWSNNIYHAIDQAKTACGKTISTRFDFHGKTEEFHLEFDLKEFFELEEARIKAGQALVLRFTELGWITTIPDELRATLFHQEVVTTPNPAQESTDEEKKDDFKDVERDDLIDWGGAPFDDDDDPLA